MRAFGPHGPSGPGFASLIFFFTGLRPVVRPSAARLSGLRPDPKRSFGSEPKAPSRSFASGRSLAKRSFGPSGRSFASLAPFLRPKGAGGTQSEGLGGPPAPLSEGKVCGPSARTGPSVRGRRAEGPPRPASPAYVRELSFYGGPTGPPTFGRVVVLRTTSPSGRLSGLRPDHLLRKWAALRAARLRSEWSGQAPTAAAAQLLANGSFASRRSRRSGALVARDWGGVAVGAWVEGWGWGKTGKSLKWGELS